MPVIMAEGVPVGNSGHIILVWQYCQGVLWKTTLSDKKENAGSTRKINMDSRRTVQQHIIRLFVQQQVHLAEMSSDEIVDLTAAVFFFF